VGQARLDEAVVEGLRVVELVPILHPSRPDDQDVVGQDFDALALGGGLEVVVVERLALVEPLLAAVPRHVDEHAAPDDALFGDGQHGCLLHGADGGAGVVAVPELAVVPDVAERVVLRGALQEDPRGVVGVMQAAGERGSALAVPGGFVELVLALDALTAGPQRVTGALGAAHVDLQSERLTGLDVLHPAQHLGRVEVVEGAELVVGAPLAPVGGSVGTQDLCHRGYFGHHVPACEHERKRPSARTVGV
jgi:hypothetical protein